MMLFIFCLFFALVCVSIFLFVYKRKSASPIAEPEAPKDEQDQDGEEFVIDVAERIVAEAAAEEAEETSHYVQNKQLMAAFHRKMEEEFYFLNPEAKVDDLAQELATNRTYITRLMRQEYGLTFTEYINVARIQYSQQLLYNDGSLTLEEVAMQSGFQSASNYCRTFKRYTGTTPMSWLHQTVD